MSNMASPAEVWQEKGVKVSTTSTQGRPTHSLGFGKYLPQGEEPMELQLTRINLNMPAGDEENLPNGHKEKRRTQKA